MILDALFRCLAPTARIAACLLPIGLAFPAAAAQAQGLRDLLSAIVMVESEVRPDARTAGTLGSERLGSGVVIDGSGLVATTGYLVLEASSVWVRTGGGQRSRADVVAYDSHSGFGLLRAREPLDSVVPMRLGDSSSLREGAPAMVASFGGPATVRPLVTAGRREFAGYWEYLLEDAIFTTPTYALFGGAALMSPDGELLGIGSLALRDISAGGPATPGNLFIPIDRLKAGLGEMLGGARHPGPARPWLGLYADEVDGHIVVTQVAEDGPSLAAGVESGDVVVSVGNREVASLAGFYRSLWSDRRPGDRIPIGIVRDGTQRMITVTSADRYDWLRFPR